jgi:hypothetical protein
MGSEVAYAFHWFALGLLVGWLLAGVLLAGVSRPSHPQARVYRMSITYPPELLPKPEPGDEVEIIVDHHDWRAENRAIPR